LDVLCAPKAKGTLLQAYINSMLKRFTISNRLCLMVMANLSLSL
jgi:hypothetical protein